jgi:hypothetical protein
MPRAHHREAAFLRQAILYDDTAERHKLEQRITHIEQDVRCLRRAIWLMVLLTAVGFAGLCYCAVFLADFPQNMEQFSARLVVKVFGALGLGSLISLLAFICLGVAYRREANLRREECRSLIAKLLESRLGKPATRPLDRLEKGLPAEPRKEPQPGPRSQPNDGSEEIFLTRISQ